MKDLKTIPDYYHRLHHLFFLCISKEVGTPQVHPGQGALLGCLLGNGSSISQKDLCQKLQVSAAAVAVSLRRLETQGLLIRTQNPSDLREKMLTLTPLGERMAKDLLKAKQRVESQAIKDFTSDELTILEEYLKRIATSLTDFLNEQDTGHEKLKGDENK